jgi:NAD(P)-dependent dehydrogenase (short-subunit alcohol dehydrogenase family)
MAVTSDRVFLEKSSMTRRKSDTIAELFDLESRVALVTGGAGHLGSEISEALAEAGATVVIASRNLANCRKLAKRIELWGGSAGALKLDVTSDASVKQCIAEVRKRYGRLDVLVNNAITKCPKPSEKVEPRDFTATLEGCLTSAYRVTRFALPLLKKSAAASIVNISTMYALVAPDPETYKGTKFFSAIGYGEAKAGLLQLTRRLAADLGAEGVRVNAISPGPFPHASTQKSGVFMRRLAKRCVLGRLGQPAEIKGAVLFLASDASSFVTGHNLVVDGGWTVR